MATDPDSPPAIRDLATQGLADIDRDGKVNGHYQRVVNATTPTSTRTSTDSLAAFTDPTGRVSAEEVDAGGAAGGRTRRRGVRSFVLTWTSLDGWDRDYDPAAIGPALTPQQWTAFDATVQATLAFHTLARAARHT